MMHCNLKPSKILLNDSNCPILNGIGRKYTREEIENEEENRIIINYMAPEVIENQQYSIKSDFIIFGAI